MHSSDIVSEDNGSCVVSLVGNGSNPIFDVHDSHTLAWQGHLKLPKPEHVLKTLLLIVNF